MFQLTKDEIDFVKVRKEEEENHPMLSLSKVYTC